MKFGNIIDVVFILLILTNILFSEENYNDNWPNWRGPNTDGVSLTGTPPIEWSETKNLKWKTPIPGFGLGTPVVWGDQVFLTTAIELDTKAEEEAIKRLKKNSPTILKVLRMSQTTENFFQFVVYSINRKSGEINWKKMVREQYPHEGVQVNSSWASASCVTDGEHVIASFGSYGIYCFDMAGKLIWEKDFGDMQVQMTWGEGTSPVLYKDKLIIVWDHEGQSKLYVLNKKTGEEIWQIDREENTTWATPLVVELENMIQLVVPGKNSKGYDLGNGEEIWEYNELDGDIIACPVFDGERVFLMTGMDSKKIISLDLSKSKGNLDNSDAVTWSYDKNTSYIPSPLLKDGKLYYLKGSRSQLSCVDSKTGNIYYNAVKPDGMKGAYASPVWANGYIYILDRKGNCSVVKDGDEFKVITKNKLNDKFDVSPAIVGKDLFLRGHNNLYCISE